MATKKETNTITIGTFKIADRILNWSTLQEEYETLVQQIADLTEEKDTIKELLIAGIQPHYDQASKLRCGDLEFASRITNEVDQVKAYTAFSKKALRDILFPTALEFKPGKNKSLLLQHGLLIQKYSAPVVTIKKAA